MKSPTQVHASIASLPSLRGGHGCVDPAAPLSPDQLLAAVAGHIEHGSPLIGSARELGDLHAALVRGQLNSQQRAAPLDEASVRMEIVKVIADIDSWAVFHLRRNPHARKHTHSLGEVISHIAATYANAWWTVRHTNKEEELRHEAWFHLGQVQEGYADLVQDIRAGRVQLPLGWSGIRGTPTTGHTPTP